MTGEQLRAQGRAVLDWIIDYHAHADRHPVRAQCQPGDITAALPKTVPEEGQSLDNLLGDVERLLLPGITHWQSPSFFAYFPANTSGPSILGDLLCAGLAVQGMLWETSPACTELETVVLDWMAQLLDLPERFTSASAGGGVLQDSASSATLCSLIAARERELSGAGNRDGLLDSGVQLVAYASEQAHSSIEKAARIAGIGSANLRAIPTGPNLAMDPAALAQAMQQDRDNGKVPFWVCATVGTTATGAFDPLVPIAEACAQSGAWLHVDGAMFGTAAACPEHRWIHRGLERADSYCVNAHKWMLTGFDCCCFFVADRGALTASLSINPEYLRSAATETGRVIDYRDWQVPLGRRFRSLKLWLVLRHYGIAGIRQLVRYHVALTQQLAVCIAAHDKLQIAAPHPFNLVCFRHTDGDEATAAIRDQINASGEAYLSHCVIDGALTLRICIGQTNTSEEHVDRLWHAIVRYAQ